MVKNWRIQEICSIPEPPQHSFRAFWRVAAQKKIYSGGPAPRIFLLLTTLGNDFFFDVISVCRYMIWALCSLCAWHLHCCGRWLRCFWCVSFLFLSRLWLVLVWPFAWSALRVLPAETRLTVYHRRRVFKNIGNFELTQKSSTCPNFWKYPPS